MALYVTKMSDYVRKMSLTHVSIVHYWVPSSNSCGTSSNLPFLHMRTIINVIQ